MAKKSIHPRVEIGHVHLKVADLERALAFYNGVLGFELTMRMGSSAAFLSAAVPASLAPASEDFPVVIHRHAAPPLPHQLRPPIG